MAPVIAKTQMSRREWLEWLAKCCRFDLRNMFDAMDKLKNITEFDENERAAVAGFEFYEHFEGKSESRKAVGRTKKFKFMDRLHTLGEGLPLLRGSARTDRARWRADFPGCHGELCRCCYLP